jgi:V8-like Glu-specific endopeptidase
MNASSDGIRYFLFLTQKLIKMKITKQKNLAFSNQRKPMTSEEILKKVKPVKPRKKLTTVELDMNLLVPTQGNPEFSVVKKKDGSSKLSVKNFKPGEYVFGPDMKVKKIKMLGNKSKQFKEPLVSKHFLPGHLELTNRPKPIKMIQQPFIDSLNQGRKKGNQATTIFPPDNRRIFQDTGYPWGCCGRVDSPLGQGSGVMVGPRHLLTVSHVVQWNDDGTAGWIKFTPGFFNGAEPFGHAFGSVTYFKDKVDGPTIGWWESMYDYVCVVLNSPIGNLTGWMGAKGYTDSWDGGNYWAHVGYPGDLTGGNRPTFQNNISLDGKWYEFDSHEAMDHTADVWPGQSGGPFFGWWANGPYAVAVQSSQDSSENDASGGQDMVDLILQARSDHP